MEMINKKLKKAAISGDAVELKALLSEPGCDALSKDQLGITPLMHAARAGKEACVRLLLPVSDPLSKDVRGWTALMHASAKGLSVCVRILLPGSDAWVTDRHGWTALMVAAYYGSEACVGLLLPVSDAFARHEKGLTALDWAKEKGHEEVESFIDAYVLAQKERAAIGVAVRSGGPRGRVAPRV